MKTFQALLLTSALVVATACSGTRSPVPSPDTPPAAPVINGGLDENGAPRVVRDKVIIGNSGAEMGVRGYVSAYDSDTGELVWRFYTVPGNPADGFENDAMRMAAETWTGEWWTLGGGGTAWDSIIYDPELNLVYIGTGNLNNKTARSYTDVALLTADQEIGEELQAVFNILTGYSAPSEFEHLLVSPFNMRRRFFERIDREIEHARAGRGGSVRGQLNGLADRRLIGERRRPQDGQFSVESGERTVDVRTAISGTAITAPAIPAISVPAVTASSTGTGCSRNARPTISGSSRFPSNCCTAMTAASTSSASVGPLETSATSTAAAPATVAPMIGTKPPRKVSNISGATSGTPINNSASPMPTASTAATTT